MPSYPDPTESNPTTEPTYTNRLRDGCYLIRYIPTEPSPDVHFYEGTLRVLHLGPNGEVNPHGEIKASGDLYSRLMAFPHGRAPEEWLSRARTTDAAAITTLPGVGADASKAALPDFATLPDPDIGIPIFPRSDYCHFLEVIRLLEGVPAPGSLTMRFQVHEFSRDGKWPNPGSRIAVLDSAARPKDFPRKPQGRDDIYFSGRVLDEKAGQPVGILRIGWLGPDLRRARIVINQVQGTKAPGDVEAWRKAFNEARWKLELEKRSCDVPAAFAPPDNRWTVGELQNALLQAKEQQLETPTTISIDPRREIQPSLETGGVDLLDIEWCYHLICVPLIDGFDRGVMFDTYGGDSNNVPREGAAVAAEWRFTNAGDDKRQITEGEARWGNARGKLQDVADVYLRVAVHEIGHAMGLDHNFKDEGFMNTTDSIADERRVRVEAAAKEQKDAEREAMQNNVLRILAETAKEVIKKNANNDSADVERAAEQAGELAAQWNQKVAEAVERTDAETFPNKIQLAFHPDDLNRLRFGPDVSVRPGTTFDDYGPLFSDEEVFVPDGVELEVWPLLDAVPLGAPVRIQMQLKNTSMKYQGVPRRLSLGAGTVSGRVFDPDDNGRSFWPVKLCLEDDELEFLAPNATSTHSITLVRGAQKALFPMEGEHRVRVRAAWKQGRTKVSLEQETTVRITPPVDESHRAAAYKMISTPDILLSLAVGGEHLKEGNDAIKVAVNNPVLRPHFVIADVKRLLTRDPTKGVEIAEKDRLRILDACQLIDNATVLSFQEIHSIETLLRSALEERPEIVYAVGDTLRTALNLLDRKIDALLLEEAVEAPRALVLKQTLSQLRDAIAGRTGI